MASSTQTRHRGGRNDDPWSQHLPPPPPLPGPPPPGPNFIPPPAYTSSSKTPYVPHDQYLPGQHRQRGVHRAIGDPHPAPMPYYPDENTKWRSVLPPSLLDESTSGSEIGSKYFSGPLPNAHPPHTPRWYDEYSDSTSATSKSSRSSISSSSNWPADNKIQHSSKRNRERSSRSSPTRSHSDGRKHHDRRSTGTSTRSKNRTLHNPLHFKMIDRLDPKSVNKALIFCKAPGAVAAALAVIQHCIRLMHMRHPGRNLNLSKSRGAHLDLSKTATVISDFRNVTSIGKILNVYTSAKSRKAAQEGDMVVRALDLFQLLASIISLSGKGLGWMCRKNILQLSSDPARHTKLQVLIDSSGAKVWMSLMLFNFFKMGKEWLGELKEERAQKRRIESGNFDPLREAAITAARQTPEAIKARKKRMRSFLINCAYMPVAVGYSFSGKIVGWKGISIFTVIAQSLKARGYFVDALRAIKALKH